MSEQEQLPVCRLRGADPLRGRNLCKCSTRGCGMSRNVIRDSDWRRLMTRPRLAPEHVVWLRLAMIGALPHKADAIRAALAALGEEVRS